MVYDFFIYGGKNDNGVNPLTAKDIVLKLSKDIPKNNGFQLYFDNWVSTMEITLALKLFRTFSTATFRTNCLNGCPLSTGKDWKSKVVDHLVTAQMPIPGFTLLNVFILLWHFHTWKQKRRWNGIFRKKQHIQVKCPYNVASYNASMGGFDLAGMLIALYRTKIMNKKRYYLKIIFHIVDVCKVNEWLLPSPL